MKRIFTTGFFQAIFVLSFVIVSTNLSGLVHAHPVNPPQPPSLDALGLWQQSQPVYGGPGLYITGQLWLEANRMTYTSVCQLRNGYNLSASVDSASYLDFDFLNILESKYSETRAYGITCYAKINAGRLFYRLLNPNQLLLQVPHTGERIIMYRLQTP